MVLHIFIVVPKILDYLRGVLLPEFVGDSDLTAEVQQNGFFYTYLVASVFPFPESLACINLLGGFGVSSKIPIYLDFFSNLRWKI